MRYNVCTCICTTYTTCKLLIRYLIFLRNYETIFYETFISHKISLNKDDSSSEDRIIFERGSDNKIMIIFIVDFSIISLNKSANMKNNGLIRYSLGMVFR